MFVTTCIWNINLTNTDKMMHACRLQALGGAAKLDKVDGFFEEVVPELTDKQYKEQFRLSRHTVGCILEALDEDDDAQIPLAKKLLLLLWYLGSVVSIRKVAMMFGLSLGAAWASMDQVVTMLVGLQERHVRFPPKAQLEDIMDRFADKGFPGAIGAVDGCHIRIPRPSENEHAYVNRKHYHSIVLMAVVDDQCRFMDICVGWPGSVHDSRVFKNSPLGMKLTSPQFREQTLPDDSHIIGDAAFQLSTYLLTPFRDNQIRARGEGEPTPEQKKYYNYKLSGARAVVEHAFGLLKGRFRRLDYLETKSIEKANRIVGSACVLHNMCGENDQWDDADDNPVGANVEHAGNAAPHVDGVAAVTKRFRIVRQLWQQREQ